MTFAEIFTLPASILRHHKWRICAALLIIMLSAIYPSDIESYRDTPPPKAEQAIANGIEHYGRHINTILPLATVLILRDWTGLKQIIVFTGAGIIATHGPKRLLNNLQVFGVRMGERPRSPDSRHNMPSGHSALASAGAYFMMRRYSVWFCLIVIPIMLLTMYARVVLDAHTISATIAGATTGMLVTGLFCTKRLWRAGSNESKAMK